MGKISLCLGLFAETSADGSGIPNSHIYENGYKTLAAYLFSHENVPFSFFFSGHVLEWLQSQHGEYLLVIEELLARKQIEVIGGGYYNPHFPLLQPADRTGQIEALTTALRRHFKKRPHGCFINESVWDPSLINTLNSCSLEYVMLDYTFFASDMSDPKALTVSITEDMGKSIFVLPLHNELFDTADMISPEAFLEKLRKIVPSSLTNPTITCFIPAEKLAGLIQQNWLEECLALLDTTFKDKIELSLPGKVLKNSKTFNKAIIPSGMSKKASSWALKAYSKAAPNKNTTRATIRNFSLLYPEVLNLYSRMSYTSLLVGQCRGDKVRKKAAREELWKAQNGAAYWYLGSGGITNTKLRNEMYKNLLHAEQLVREVSNVNDALNSFDVNFDGSSEYVAQFKLYDAYLSKTGGSIYEFDILPCERNFAATISDRRRRGLFSDFLVNDKDFSLLSKGQNPDSISCLSEALYNELKYDRTKKNLKLEAQVLFEKKKSAKIVKEFHFTKDSIRVDYRLINTSKENINAYLIIENNLCMQSNSPETLSLECSADDLLLPIAPETDFFNNKGIFYLRMTDSLSQCCFTLSSSDAAGVYAYPYFSQQQYLASTTGLFWKISLLPGAVCSRTVTLYIKRTETHQHKRKS